MRGGLKICTLNKLKEDMFYFSADLRAEPGDTLLSEKMFDPRH